MAILKALASGLAGACVLTLLHETTRHTVPNAPRMDLLGMRAIADIMKGAGKEPPADDKLHRMAMAGDIVSNSLYYSLAGTGNGAWLRGALLGAGAGLGAIVLPGPLGLGEAPSSRTPQTKAMTFGLYLAGGLVAAAVGHLLASED
ncbi:hypothetical protein [Pontibacter sp. SGAir0037]|uniref:hypothetical protein n=1 Tax=Pontibacter sp. SGAir0037 TaxID=2571030 RepID=UPI0010CCFBF2|nr:hypothetical protein [Pontibacter sp. SGAir0037]QCR24237.1 hypothetical protein C1N53_19005 [Pontibacter sp. SGAir0037]